MEKHFNRYIKIHPVRFGVGFLLLPAVFTSILIWPFQVFYDDFKSFQYLVPYLLLGVVIIMYLMLVRAVKNFIGPKLSLAMQALWLNQGVSKKTMFSMMMRYVTQIEMAFGITIAVTVWLVFPKSMTQVKISSIIVSLMLLAIIRIFIRGRIQIILFSEKNPISGIPLCLILIATTYVLKVDNEILRNSIFAIIGVAALIYMKYTIDNTERPLKIKLNYLNRDQH
ncbi:hypothetical protein [Erysipelothrix anatis]|uniref:hypothetical protein n=1 Tax=Erysipelothrix anatis TaxID=2683713 RepID=UPI001359A2DA|nr:hypothetical protein [Erysipelothrix anatis]